VVTDVEGTIIYSNPVHSENVPLDTLVTVLGINMLVNPEHEEKEDELSDVINNGISRAPIIPLYVAIILLLASNVYSAVVDVPTYIDRPGLHPSNANASILTIDVGI
jgi:hypothetical protein